jgi:phosphate acetyltransferase
VFLESMREKVRGQGMRIACPEGTEERVITAAVQIRDQDWGKPVLMGEKSAIEAVAKTMHVDLDGIELHDPSSDSQFDKYVDTYFELRKHKGITREQAQAKIKLPHYFGASMLRAHAVDGVVCGLNSDTKPFIPAFEIIQMQEGFRRVSSLFVLEWPERFLFFADCAVNKNPDAQGLADIAHATAQTVRTFGYEPRIAFLSFSTHGSANGPEVEKVREAFKISKAEGLDCALDGEIQFDAALLPDIAKRKKPDSPFAEKGANVFIFPDLNSGNIAYKITERLGKALATGPILQGLKQPINDVSRGCTAEGFANVMVLTAAQALFMR